MQKYSNILQLVSFLLENKQTNRKTLQIATRVCACVFLSMLHCSYQTRTHRSISQPSAGKAPVCEWACVFAGVYRIAPSFLPRLMSSGARPENNPMKMEKQRYTGKNTGICEFVCVCVRVFVMMCSEREKIIQCRGSAALGAPQQIYQLFLTAAGINNNPKQ